MITGASTASRAGVTSSRWAARVQMLDDPAVLGLLGAVHDPGVLAELASHLLDDRAGGAADGADGRPEKRKAIEPPISTPMNVVGLATLIWVAASWNRAEPVACRFSWLPIVSTNEAKRATVASTAEAIATPLVIALVVLPTASRLTITRSASPPNSPAISAMPAALSDTGPKLSSDTTMPVVESSPMPVSATRNKASSMFPWAVANR